MADVMRVVPFEELLERITGELRNQGSIFNIKKEMFFSDDEKKSIKVFNQSARTPLGPAAGPHTQLAQNIITSYLVGARFIELKTVQIMDSLEIAKPCIDARDEGYNTEWSTELSLEKAFDEYLKAWFIVHVLDIVSHDGWNAPGFIFNMSVGYNLEGIKSERMDKFITQMMDARKSDLFEQYKASLKAMMEDGIFSGTIYEGKEADVIKNIDKISAHISPSVTLSTMHGCPPAEIEAIASYMLDEKGLDTFIKLNPTLLGYDEVRRILDGLGYDYLTLRRESFDHDLQYSDAIGMLKRLVAKAEKDGRGFGVKLTNTLGSVNNQGVLPGDEMYMSGRALMPISLSVALKLSKEFDGKLPISYSGGANAFNIKELFETGIRPITVATDMLQPGGYYRMREDARILSSISAWESSGVDVGKLEALSEKAKNPKAFSAKEFKGFGSIKLNQELPLLDCFVAPCVESCPIHQMIPDYVNLAGEGRGAEALALIYLDNALPNITGWICSHECQNHCTRKDYEGAVKIREVKKRLATSYFDEYKKELWETPEEGSVKAAVIGAGPAGLAAAFFLRRAGFKVSVFEKDESAGGVCKSTIPDFRIPASVVDKDVAFIEENGVDFHFNVKKSIKELKSEGFEYVFVAIGAEKSKNLKISGNGSRESAISFLRRVKRKEDLRLGKNVVVVGAGNTAMDASRAAKRVPGVESVNIVYRRSFAQMPADREEYEEALSEGIVFNWLNNPISFVDGILTLNKMTLGEKDSSGRRRPVETGETVSIPCDYLIQAIGEDADDAALNEICYQSEEEKVYLIGDALSGPSTVVECIASARKAVEEAIDKVYEDIIEEEESEEEEECSCSHHHHHDSECSCGHHHDDEHECSCDHDGDEEDEDGEDDEALRDAEDEYFASLLKKKSSILSFDNSLSDSDFFKREASRCLECSYMCSKCVDVCPNRANVPIDMRAWEAFSDPFEIVHIDAYCNECGNCETFCPYSGGPYRKKFTVFSLREDFDNSANDGFFYDGESLIVRYEGEVLKGDLDKEGLVNVEGLPPEVEMLIDEIFTSYHYLLGPVEE